MSSSSLFETGVRIEPKADCGLLAILETRRLPARSLHVMCSRTEIFTIAREMHYDALEMVVGFSWTA